MMRKMHTMKGLVVVLTIVGLAGLFGFVLAETSTFSSNPSPEEIANQWTSEEHMMAANLFEETAARLESKVSHLEQRIARFSKKPYLDPKGFKRQGWKLLMGSHKAELKELREQIAWHHAQAKQFNAKPVSEEIGKENRGKKS